MIMIMEMMMMMIRRRRRRKMFRKKKTTATTDSFYSYHVSLNYPNSFRIHKNLLCSNVPRHLCGSTYNRAFLG